MKDGWVKKTLGEVCVVERGSSPRPIERYLTDSSDGVNWVKIGDTKNVDKYIRSTKQKITREGAEKSRRVDPGDFILSNSMSFGKPYVMATSGYVHDGWFILRLLESIDVDFFHYLLSSDFVQAQFISLAAGSVVKNISKDLVKRAVFPIPPLPEQKQIVAILDEAFEGIDRAIANAEKNLANSRKLFESYLNFKLLAVASGKPTQNLSCITELIIDCEHKTAPTQETGIPSIRTPNIGKGYLIFDNVNRVSEETYKLWTRRGKPESGDLILAREAPAGNVGVIPPNTKVCLGQRTVLIRPNKESVDSQYLAFLLLHPLMQKRLLAKSTGATVQHVNMKDIRELSISELPPVQAQRDCIEELEQLQSQVNSLETIYRQKISALKELKQSILQKAFTGELTADTANQVTKTAKEGIAA